MGAVIPDGRSKVEFDNFTTLQRGKDLTGAQFREGSVPVADLKGIIDFNDTPILKTPGVTVGRSGSAGKVTVYSEEFLSHNTSLYVRGFHGNDPHFAGYLMESLNLSRFKIGTSVPTLDCNSFKMFSILILPLPEQKKTAHIPSMLQGLIEAQVQIIQTTTELKRALMHKIFTEDLRNEPQKQTEIGLVSASGEVVRCAEICKITSVGIVVKPTQYYVSIGAPTLRSQNVRVDRMQMEPRVYISEEANDGPVTKSKLRTGGVSIVRSGPNFGMSCVLPAELNDCNCIDLLFIRTKLDQLNGSFLSRFVNSEEVKKQVSVEKAGMAQPHFNVGTVKRNFISLPPLEEQNEIVNCFEQIDKKHDLATSKRHNLQDLFRTLLYKLTTAKTRVHEMEITT